MLSETTSLQGRTLVERSEVSNVPDLRSLHCRQLHIVPATVTVPVGTRVTWTSRDQGEAHDHRDRRVILQPLPSQGATFARTFSTAGTFEIF